MVSKCRHGYTPEEMSRLITEEYCITKLNLEWERFWRYRTRLVKALKAAEWPQRISTLNCASGCDGNWVRVRYHQEFCG